MRHGANGGKDNKIGVDVHDQQLRVQKSMTSTLITPL
jgi:hypothetical protein